MASPNYSPIGGYGSKSNNYNYVQTNSGGKWSTTPASQKNVKSSGSGSVLGLQATPSGGTGGGTTAKNIPSGDNGSKKANEAVSNADSRVRDSIKARAGQLRTGYEQMESRIPQYEVEDTQYVNDQYGNMASGYQSQYDSTLGLLGNKREAVGAYKTGAINEMGSDMRNSLLASQMKIGAMGGGNSSASEVLLPYAFAKESGKQRASIINQANSQYGQLDNEEISLKSNYDQGKLEIDNWKITALDGVKQNARAELQRIQEAKLQANDMEYAALQELEMSLLNNAANQLAQIQAEERNRRTYLEDWARERMTSLQDYKMQLSQSSQFNPEQMTYDALDVGNFGGNANSAYVPYVTKKKKGEYGY